jgi:hypothetical protein
MLVLSKWFACFPLTLATLVIGVRPSNGQIIRMREKPQVSVHLQHAAATGVDLQGKKVAFGQIAGPCADQFSDLIAPALQAKGVEVINREHLNAVLAEHRFQVSSSVDPTTAVELGRILGPSIMIFVNVSRCGVEHKLLYEDQFAGPRVNVSRTEAHFLASVHTVDLATGGELAVQSIEANPKAEHRSTTGIPEYPSEIEAQDEAVRLAAGRVEHLYFPWTENRAISFMNGKESNLRQAYDLMKAGEYDAALKLSEQNVETCRSDPKVNHQADAWYNLGIAYMVADDYNHALDALNQANQLHSDKTTLDAIAECRTAKAGTEAVASRASEQAQEAERQSAERQQRADETAKAALTNEAVVKMVKGGLSEDVIVRMIANQPGRFALTPDDLVNLKRAGVPDKVIAAMLDKK